MPRSRPMDPSITRRSTPVASVCIVRKGSESGSAYADPGILGGASSYSIEGRRLKLYPDGSGEHVIPQEWREEGVTISGHRTGGSTRDRYIAYEFSIGK